jgi:hypothetical protein
MAKRIRDAVIFAGQSNGQTFRSVPSGFPGGWTADGNIQIWTGSPTANSWQTYDPGTNSDPTNGSVFWGPEAEFARQWRIDSQDPLFVIKRCIGGTGLITPSGTTGRTWDCHELNGEFSLLYDDVVAAAAALAGIQLNVRAFVWIGNESDTTVDQATANKVQRELDDWFAGLRVAISIPRAKGVVVMCKNQAPNGAYTSTIRAAQQYVGSQPDNTYVDEDPLAFEGTAPGSHLVPADVVKLGALLYSAYKTAAAAAVGNTPKPLPPSEQQWVDPQTGRPSQTFYNYAKILDARVRAL